MDSPNFNFITKMLEDKLKNNDINLVENILDYIDTDIRECENCDNQVIDCYCDGKYYLCNTCKDTLQQCCCGCDTHLIENGYYTNWVYGCDFCEYKIIRKCKNEINNEPTIHFTSGNSVCDGCVCKALDLLYDKNND